GTTTTGRFALPPTVRDGRHRWRVIATDRRGQVTRTPRRTLRQDGTAPRATVRVSGARRSGRPIGVAVRATDANRAGRPSSGLRRVTIAWGDGSRTVASRAAHAYRRGSFTLRVSVRDRAGNVTVVRRRLTIR